MYFLLSGEGATDMGVGSSAISINEGDDFLVGPMALVVDRIAQPHLGESLLNRRCGLVTESLLVARAGQLKAAKKGMRIPGRKRAKETLYFFKHAQMLARLALTQANAIGDKVVAVLFRDADTTASAGRGLWDAKQQSILDGFKEEGFAYGVPMVPKPISEAWLICALKDNPYYGCGALEERSGSDRSPASLKRELELLIGQTPSRDVLCQVMESEEFDAERIDMPSFNAFRQRLIEVL